MVIIDNVSYAYQKLYSGEGIIDVDYNDVSIDYRILQKHGHIVGRATIGFDEYKQMNHYDLIEEVEKLFKEGIKESF